MKRFRSVMYGILIVNALALSGCGGWYGAEYHVYHRGYGYERPWDRDDDDRDRDEHEHRRGHGERERRDRDD